MKRESHDFHTREPPCLGRADEAHLWATHNKSTIDGKLVSPGRSRILLVFFWWIDTRRRHYSSVGLVVGIGLDERRKPSTQSRVRRQDTANDRIENDTDGDLLGNSEGDVILGSSEGDLELL